jgi:prepilin-type N-terminal cleavage/methylation domain-containing protein
MEELAVRRFLRRVRREETGETGLVPADPRRRLASTEARRSGRAGFSLVEVLVTVAIVGSAVVGLLGVVRTQIRATDALRCHSEARLLLQEAADRFQFGEEATEDATGDSLIVGRHGSYQIFFQPDGIPSGDAAVSGDGGVERWKIGVRWKQGGQEHSLVWVAWR